jgi:hypothetical protein
LKDTSGERGNIRTKLGRFKTLLRRGNLLAKSKQTLRWPDFPYCKQSTMLADGVAVGHFHRTGDRSADLCHLYTVGEPGAKQIAFVVYEDLGLVLDPAKRPVQACGEQAAMAARTSPSTASP